MMTLSTAYETRCMGQAELDPVPNTWESLFASPNYVPHSPVSGPHSPAAGPVSGPAPAQP
jgi:hypothetical protein